MKVVVAVKQTPSPDSVLTPDESAKWVQEENLSFEMNEPDAYALEAALQLREKQGGEVIAITLGPERAEKVLREALAKGADRAIHAVCPSLDVLDPLQTAQALAEVVRPEAPHLVLTGLQSGDLGFAQTGVILAELLSLPHATIIVGVEPAPGGVRAKRELEGGWYQFLELPLPAVLTVQSGISRLRYATLMGIKKARTKEIRRVHVATPPPTGGPAALVRLYPPDRSTHTEFLEGDPREVAASLVERLRFEARVL